MRERKLFCGVDFNIKKGLSQDGQTASSSEQTEQISVGGRSTDTCTRGHEGTRQCRRPSGFFILFQHRRVKQNVLLTHIFHATRRRLSQDALASLCVQGLGRFASGSAGPGRQFTGRSVCEEGSEASSLPDLVSSHHSPAQSKKRPVGQTSSSDPHCRNKQGKACPPPYYPDTVQALELSSTHFPD